MKGSLLFLALFLTLCEATGAGQLEDALKRLDKAIEQELAGADSSSTMTVPGLALSRRAARTEFQSVERSDPTQVGAVLYRLSNAFTSEAVHREILALQEILRHRREAEERATLARIDAALARAREVLQTARDARELDPILAALQRLPRSSTYAASPGAPLAFGQVQESRDFVASWQDYLAAQASRNLEAQREALSRCARSNQVKLMPRSRVLETLHGLSSVPPEPAKTAPTAEEQLVALIGGIQSLDEVAAAIGEVLRIGKDNTDPADTSISTALAFLQPIETTYREFRQGLPTSLRLLGDRPDVTNHPVAITLIPLRARLLLHVLPRYLGAPDETKPRPRESVSDFLDRVANEAKARGDIALALRAREAKNRIQRSDTYTESDATGMREFVTARNQEAAGEVTLAVASYLEALKSGSDLIPGVFIGERLKAIKAAHPREYEEVISQARNPPRITPRSLIELRMRMPHSPPRGPVQGTVLMIPPPVTSPSPDAISPSPTPRESSRRAEPDGVSHPTQTPER